LSAQVSEVLRRGEHWLRSQQLSSGAWRGSWAVNFLYGTWFGIEGLRACGAPNTDRAIWKACQWVVEQQREEGGWGEHHDSCVTGEYIALDHSQVIQTSWALLCLLRGGSHEWDAIERGARYLVEQLQEDGHWPTQEPAGVFFQSALLDYKLYKSYFPLWALGMYEERRKLRIELEEDKTNSRKRTLQA
jgi:lanosterol synthase